MLVAGGSGNSGILASAELYNQSADTWSPTGSMKTVRAYRTAIRLTNGKVLVAGGNDSSGAVASAELYTP